jgi:hypothetical protein
MSQEQFRTNPLASFILIWIAFSLLAALSLCAPTVGQQPTSLFPELRECKPGFDASPTTKKKPQQSKKSKVADQAPASQACMEIRYPALMIQERLQNHVRAQRWNISEEQTSEDTWTFSLMLSKDQLGSYTKPQVLPKVTWHGGKSSVQVRTNELPDGFTRVVFSVRFEGYGEAEDQFAAQHESWPLASNGTLESSLLDVVRLPSAVPSSNLQN